jgi:hypothetical protein
MGTLPLKRRFVFSTAPLLCLIVSPPVTIGTLLHSELDIMLDTSNALTAYTQNMLYLSNLTTDTILPTVLWPWVRLSF